jgi:hypothetical protein
LNSAVHVDRDDAISDALVQAAILGFRCSQGSFGLFPIRNVVTDSKNNASVWYGNHRPVDPAVRTILADVSIDEVGYRFA